MEMKSKVCVTGAAGYLGSCLVTKLLQKGYTIHATTRNLAAQSKVGLLKGLPHAECRLRLFEADIYNPYEFMKAIEGCEFVIHMATIMHYEPQNSQYKDMSEAAVAGVKSIVEACIRSGTVKRLIYTASVVAASPLKDDHKGFKDTMDETCWTPLDFIHPNNNETMIGYTSSKILSEQEVLKNNNNGTTLEVVSIASALVGGETLCPSIADSMGLLVSQVTKNKLRYQFLRLVEDLLGKVPIVHVEDVCDAHIFCMEKPSINGRFLCANGYVKSAELATYWKRNYPDIDIHEEFVEDTKREVVWGSRKLKEIGFEFKHDLKRIVEDSLNSALNLGEVQLTQFGYTFTS